MISIFSKSVFTSLTLQEKSYLETNI